MDIEKRVHIYSEWINQDGSTEYNNRLALEYDGFKYCIHADTIRGMFPFTECDKCPHRMKLEDGDAYCKMILKRQREILNEAHEKTEMVLGGVSYG